MNWQVLGTQIWALIPPFIKTPAVSLRTRTGFIWIPCSTTSTPTAALRGVLISPVTSTAGKQPLEKLARGRGWTKHSSRPRPLTLGTPHRPPAGTSRPPHLQLQPFRRWSPPPPKSPTRPTSPPPWISWQCAGGKEPLQLWLCFWKHPDVHLRRSLGPSSSRRHGNLPTSIASSEDSQRLLDRQTTRSATPDRWSGDLGRVSLRTGVYSWLCRSNQSIL